MLALVDRRLLPCPAAICMVPAAGTCMAHQRRVYVDPNTLEMDASIYLFFALFLDNTVTSPLLLV